MSPPVIKEPSALNTPAVAMDKAIKEEQLGTPAAAKIETAIKEEVKHGFHDDDEDQLLDSKRALLVTPKARTSKVAEVLPVKTPKQSDSLLDEEPKAL